MLEINTSQWTAVGESTNSRYFVIEPGILAAVPNPGVSDDLASARSNMRFQLDYFREHGAGVVVVFFDNMTSQDKDARRVYQEEPETQLMRGTALVGGSLLSRAMGSFFMGLSKPRIPVKMFGSLSDALAWGRALNAKAGGK